MRKGRYEIAEEEEGRVGGDWKIGHSMYFAKSPCISLQTDAECARVGREAAAAYR